MWKYTVVELDFKMGGEIDLRNDLNSFGEQGWELVTMEWRDCEIIKGKKRIICTFKQRAE
jgi:hypothetical protein